MDTLANLFGIITFAVQVLRLLKRYYGNYKDHSERMKRFKNKFDLHMNSIRHTFDLLFYGMPSTGNIDILKDIFEELKPELIKLERRLKDESRQGVKARFDRFRDKLVPEHLEQKLENLSNFHNDIKDEMRNEQFNRLVIDKHDRIYSWISKYNHDTRRHKMYNLYSNDTLSWVYKDPRVMSWAAHLHSSASDNQHSETEKVLWFTGEPGVGKSVMAASLIIRLREAQENLDNEGFGLLYFFFHFEQTEQQITEAAIRSLVRQAAQQVFKVKNKLPLELMAAYTYHQDGASEPSHQAAVTLLEQILEFLPRSYIIIDGLDEYQHGSSIMESVPSVLFKMVAKPELNCKLMVTSRYSSSTWRHHCANIQMKSSRSDMIAFLSHAISRSDAPMCKWANSDPERKKEVIDMILDRSADQFQAASHGLQILKDSHSFPHFHKSISDVPSTVYSNYISDIDRIDKTKIPGSTQEPLGIQALGFVLHAKERLRSEELKLLLAVQQDTGELYEQAICDANHILQSTVGLLRLAQDGYFEFTHKTIADFLRSSSQQDRFFELEKSMAQRLHAYEQLANKNRQNMLSLLPYCSKYKWCHFFSYIAYQITPTPTPPDIASIIENAVYTLTSQPDNENVFDMQLNNGSTNLHYAAILGSDALVSSLVQAGASQNEQDRAGYTALHIACLWRRLRTVERLIRCRANINAQTYTGETPLHIACKQNQESLVDILVTNNVNFGVTDNAGRTALHIALSEGHAHIAQKLMSCYTVNTRLKDDQDMTVLLYATKLGHLDISRHLIQCGAEVNVQDSQHMSPLSYATKNNNFELSKLLIQMGSDVNRCDFNGWAPLSHAVMNNNLALSALLIQQGCEVKVRDNNLMTLLHHSAKNNSLELSELLLQHNAYIDAVDNSGNRALIYAIQNGNTKLISMLVKAGANINSVTMNGDNGLFLAAHENKVDVGQALVHLGCNTNHKNSKGYTLLHVTARDNNVGFAKLLINGGADINAVDRHGYSALLIAAFSQNQAMVNFLLSRNALVDIGFKGPRLSGELGVTLSTFKCHIKLHYAKFSSASSVATDAFLLIASTLKRPELFSLLAEACPNSVTTKAVIDSYMASLFRALIDGQQETASSMYNEGSFFFQTARSPLPLFFSGPGYLDSGLEYQLEDGKTLLHLAVEAGNTDLVRKLLTNGASTYSKDVDRFTPLYYTIEFQHLDIAKELCARGVKFNELMEPYSERCARPQKLTHSWRDMFEILGKCGISIKDTDLNTETMLYAAASRGFVSITKFLLKAGANVRSKRTGTLRTAMDGAILHGQAETMLLLRQYGA